MNNRMMLARNSTIRSIYGGYGRLVKESVLGESVYIKKGTVFNIVSFNLYTQTVFVIDKATKETISLEYEYLIENCEVIKQPTNIVLDCISIIDTTKEKKKIIDVNRLTFIVTLIIEATLLVLIIL